MKRIIIPLKGRIDSNNAASVEEDIFRRLGDDPGISVEIDMTDLEYISSAGLRVLLKVKKHNNDLTVTNVSSEVYEIFDVTGFSEMMKVEKAYRTISVDGCDVVGVGFNGTVYRIDNDTVIKVYNDFNSLDAIKHEREVARLALILGIPTAISYEVVKVGKSYGSVFELLNAQSFSQILAESPDKIDWAIRENTELLKKIHSVVVPEGKLPSVKASVLSKSKTIESLIPDGKGAKLLKMIEEIPESDHLIHGDYHTKNIMLQKDEVILIDMDTLSVGDPVFEFAQMYNSYQGFSEYDHDQFNRFQGYPREIGEKLFYGTLSGYLGTANRSKIDEVVDKSRVIGYTMLISMSCETDTEKTDKDKAELELWISEIGELLDRYDTLKFTLDEIEIEAVTDNLNVVQAFIDEKLEAADCPMKAQMQIAVAVEEIFVNIAHYAYNPDTGNAVVRVEVTDEPAVLITFVDHGVQYDPLAREDPDVTLSAEEREIGGLGIFITKKTMDDVSYEYKNGQNILKLKKNL